MCIDIILAILTIIICSPQEVKFQLSRDHKEPFGAINIVWR